MIPFVYDFTFVLPRYAAIYLVTYRSIPHCGWVGLFYVLDTLHRFVRSHTTCTFCVTHVALSTHYLLVVYSPATTRCYPFAHLCRLLCLGLRSFTVTTSSTTWLPPVILYVLPVHAVRSRSLVLDSCSSRTDFVLCPFPVLHARSLRSLPLLPSPAAFSARFTTPPVLPAFGYYVLTHVCLHTIHTGLPRLRTPHRSPRAAAFTHTLLYLHTFVHHWLPHRLPRI